MKRIAVVSAILAGESGCRTKFNETVGAYQTYICGRMGVPFPKVGIGVISLIICAEADKINEFTGKLGSIDGVSVKTIMSKEELLDDDANIY